MFVMVSRFRDAFPVATVADMQRSLGLYRELLGFELLSAFPSDEDRQFASLTVDGGKLGLGDGPVENTSTAISRSPLPRAAGRAGGRRGRVGRAPPGQEARSVISLPGVQFSRELRNDVLAGDITLTVRRWKRPQVKQGGRYRVGLGQIEVDAIALVPFAAITAADVRRCGEPDRETLRRRAAHAGPIDDDTLVYRIEFHAVAPAARADLQLDGSAVTFRVEDPDHRIADNT